MPVDWPEGRKNSVDGRAYFRFLEGGECGQSKSHDTRHRHMVGIEYTHPFNLALLWWHTCFFVAINCIVADLAPVIPKLGQNGSVSAFTAAIALSLETFWKINSLGLFHIPLVYQHSEMVWNKATLNPPSHATVPRPPN